MRQVQSTCIYENKIQSKKEQKRKPYNTATPFVADREPRGGTTSYAGGTSPLTLSCPDTNLSYNELDLTIASCCLNDSTDGVTWVIELVSAADAPESVERLEKTVSVEGPAPPKMLLEFELDDARHGQLGIKEIELSKTSEYRGREV